MAQKHRAQMISWFVIILIVIVYLLSLKARMYWLLKILLVIFNTLGILTLGDFITQWLCGFPVKRSHVRNIKK